jgi:hypothetical protein
LAQSEHVVRAARKPAAKPGKASRKPKTFTPNAFDPAAIAAHSDAIRSAPWLASLGLPPHEQSSSTPGFRILCVIPDVDASHNVLDYFDNVKSAAADAEYEADQNGDVESYRAANERFCAAGRRRNIAADLKLQERLLALTETSFIVDCADEDGEIDGAAVDQSSYDVVFLDADSAKCRSFERCGAKCIVLVDNVKRETVTRGIRTVPATLTALYRVVGDELALRRRQLAMPWAALALPLPMPLLDDAAVDEVILRWSKDI